MRWDELGISSITTSVISCSTVPYRTYTHTYVQRYGLPTYIHIFHPTLSTVPMYIHICLPAYLPTYLLKLIAMGAEEGFFYLPYNIPTNPVVQSSRVRAGHVTSSVEKARKAEMEEVKRLIAGLLRGSRRPPYLSLLYLQKRGRVHEVSDQDYSMRQPSVYVGFLNASIRFSRNSKMACLIHTHTHFRRQ